VNKNISNESFFKTVSIFLFLLIVVTPKVLFAASSSFDVFGREPLAGPCTTKTTVRELALPELWKTANHLKEQRQYCEAADYYLKIMIDTLEAAERSEAWYQRIESYFFKYDYENFFFEVETFYRERKEASQWEQIHFLLMKGLHELSAKPKSLDNPWMQYSLGIHPEQLSTETIKGIYTYRSFLEKFPNSQNAIFVRGYLDEARVDFDESYLKETRNLAMRQDYAPAIARYQFLLKQGPEFNEFPVATYELVQLMMEFSYAVIDANRVSKEKLARWLGVKSDLVDLEKRLQISKSLQSESEKIVKMMVEKIPNDPWTEKAKHEFGFILP
jgi:outer membrane protein assembly factor BamD (BamD/ComL family)